MPSVPGMTGADDGPKSYAEMNACSSHARYCQHQKRQRWHKPSISYSAHTYRNHPIVLLFSGHTPFVCESDRSTVTIITTLRAASMFIPLRSSSVAIASDRVSGAFGEIFSYCLIAPWLDGTITARLVIALKAPAVSRFLSLRYAGAFFFCLALAHALRRLVGQNQPQRVDDCGSVVRRASPLA
jgi:predicted membrane channel-forming protein YqfA (hemolysin III family)